MVEAIDSHLHNYYYAYDNFGVTRIKIICIMFKIIAFFMKTILSFLYVRITFTHTRKAHVRPCL